MKINGTNNVNAANQVLKVGNVQNDQKINSVFGKKNDFVTPNTGFSAEEQFVLTQFIIPNQDDILLSE